MNAKMLSLGFSVVLACGGGSGALPGGSSGSSPQANAPPNTAAQEKAYCDMLANRGCGGGGDTCTNEGKCFAGKMSPAAADAYNRCRSTPSCKGDDNCIAQAAVEVAGDAATNYMNECLAKRKACPSFKDDWCSPGAFAYSGVGDALVQCMAQPCEQLNACIANAAQAITVCK